MNGVMMQYFEWYVDDDGKHWQRLRDDAQHLAEIGITSVWMPPATKATGTNDVGYGIYDLFDLGEFDQKGNVRTKYGTKEEYLEAIRSLQENGIQAYADVVLNHKAGADEAETFPVYKVDPNNRQKKISEEFEIEGWTKFTFPGRGDQYSDYKWTWADFSGVDFDNKSGENAIYMIKGFDKGWADNEEVDTEKGNYDYLMNADIDYRNQNTVDEVLRWCEWFINETGVDGFRLDAVKHISDTFMAEFVEKAREVAGPQFYAVGEYWKTTYAIIEDYLDDTDFTIDLFDVKLHKNFSGASKSGSNFDMTKIFDETLVSKNPTHAVTFVDNHDSQPSQALESWTEDWFKPHAYALILLREAGLPCVFYGDYYGIGGEAPIESKQGMLDALLGLRQSHSYGPQHDYFDHPNCVGWTREGDEEHQDGMAVIMTNGDASFKDMFVGQQHAGSEFVCVFGEQEEIVTINDDGIGTFTCAPGSVAVWIKKNETA